MGSLVPERPNTNAGAAGVVFAAADSLEAAVVAVPELAGVVVAADDAVEPEHAQNNG